MKCNFEKNKRLLTMATNQMDFDQTEREAIKEAKELFGTDIFDSVFLPEEFNFGKIDTTEVRHRDLQQCKLPFDNEIVDELIKMPKVMINQPFCFNNAGKTLHGCYMVGKLNGKLALFMFKIARDGRNKDFSDVSIKLDVCIQGKAWLNLVRLDTMGNAHPNYVKNNNVVSVEEELTYARPPHLHRYDYYTQVITDTPGYMLASEIPFFDYEKDKVTDKFMFKKFVDYFMEYCNIHAKINEDVKTDYIFSLDRPLLSNDTHRITKAKHLDGVDFNEL